MRPESAASGRKLSWISLVILAVVPILAVGLLIGLVRPQGDARVNAAIVNLDEPVTLEDQYVPMGRQLAAAIVEEGGDDISWMLANEETAREGLRSGEFSVVVTIPGSFSSAATSFSENDAAKAQQATIQVDVSENAPITDAQVGEQVARLATSTINSTLTETYLDNVFIGFNTIGDQFVEIMDAVTQLSDGAGELSEGAGQAAEGGEQLAGGLGQLSEAATPLTSGGNQLANGSSQLVDGSAELLTGVGQFATGVDQLASGVDELNAGVAEFAGQAPRLVEGVGQLADGAEQLLGGIPAFADGSKQVVLGVEQLAAGLNQAAGGVSVEGVAEQFVPLVEGAQGVSQGASGVSAGLGAVNQTLSGLASGNEQAQGAAGQIAAGVTQAFQCPVDDPATCELLAQSFAAGAEAAALEGFKAGAGSGVQALTTPQDGVTLLDAAEQVADGAGQVSGGVDQVITQLPAQFEELGAGLGQLAAGADQIVTQAQPLVDNADALGAGSTQLLDGIRQLDQQVSALPKGINQLRDGVGQLVNGASQLSDGAGQLSDGASQLATGVNQFDDGLGTYVDGVNQFADGVTQAAEGAPELADGLTQLSDGTEQLHEGLGTFAGELETGAEELPSYSDDDRARLSEVITNPVSAPGGVAGPNGTATVSLLLVIGLWLGAMLSFVAVRPVPSTVVASRASSLALWARTVAMPALVVSVQGILLAAIGGGVLGLNAGPTALLALFLVGIAVSFVLANHALTAWLGNIGRGVSVLLVVATVALAVSSSGSGWLGWLAGVSPVHNAFLLVRTHVADGTGFIGLWGTALLLGVIALAASILAITSRRSLTAAQFRRRLAA